MADGVTNSKSAPTRNRTWTTTSPSRVTVGARALRDTVTEGKTPRRIVLRIKVVHDKTLVRLAGVPVGSATYNDTMKRSAREFFGISNCRCVER